jgi:hypothetical protein
VDVLNTVINAAVVAAVGSLLAWFIRGRFEENDRRWQANDRRWEESDRRLARIEGKLEFHDGRFDALDRRMDSLDRRIDSLERSVDGARSDLTRVALAVGAGPAAEAGGDS